MITRICRAAVRLIAAQPRRDPCAIAGHVPPDRYRTVTSSAGVTDEQAMRELAALTAAGASPWDAARTLFGGGR